MTRRAVCRLLLVMNCVEDQMMDRSVVLLAMAAPLFLPPIARTGDRGDDLG